MSDQQQEAAPEETPAEQAAPAQPEPEETAPEAEVPASLPRTHRVTLLGMASGIVHVDGLGPRKAGKDQVLAVYLVDRWDPESGQQLLRQMESCTCNMQARTEPAKAVSKKKGKK